MNKANTSISERIISIFYNNWDSNFIIDSLNNEEIYYRKFFSYVLNGAKILNNINTKKNNEVSLIIDNSIELVILYFSALISEITIIPIDPQKSYTEKKEILTESDSNFIICHKDDKIKQDYLSAVLIEDIREDIFLDKKISKEDLNIFDDIDYQNTFSISFTSGSTGVPKGVMHSFSNLYNSALAFSKCFNFSNKNIFYHNLPMTYMAGMLNLIIVPFVSESRIVIGERFSISNILNFWNIPIKTNVNTFFFIPTIVSLLLKLDRGTDGSEYTQNNNITACIGTAPLNQKSRNKFEKKYNTKLYESYGLSETLFVSSNSPRLERIEGVGKPLEQVNISFDNEEILIETPWNTLGYYNTEISNSKNNNYFISGDLGEINNEGYLSITGRKKDIIIKGGVNIAPIKIEKILLNINQVSEPVILGVFDKTLGEKVVCFYTGDEEISVSTKKEINNTIISQLSKDYLIDEFHLINDIPKNINGKIDKLELKRILEL